MLSRHTTDEVDAQDAVAQLLSPILSVGVVALTPKLSPDTVTLQPDVTAELASATKLTTGAVKRPKIVVSKKCRRLMWLCKKIAYKI